jgi:hypothetical protein
MNKLKRKFNSGAALKMVWDSGNRRAEAIWLKEREALQ